MHHAVTTLAQPPFQVLQILGTGEAVTAESRTLCRPAVATGLASRHDACVV